MHREKKRERGEIQKKGVRKRGEKGGNENKRENITVKLRQRR